MSTNSIVITNPYTDEALGEVPAASREDVNTAVAAARSAYLSQRKQTIFDRYQFLMEAAAAIRAHKEQLAQLLTAEIGKPIKESLIEVERAYSATVFSAEESKRLYGETIYCDVQPGLPKKTAFVLPKPLGVIGVILPFNFPLLHVAQKVCPAFAAGNSVVIKPAPEAPLTVMEIAEIFKDAGISDGLFQVCNGGNEVGQWLVESDVNGISFTGSIEAGKEVTKHAGLKKLILELGGNDPLVVMDDGDLEGAARTAVDQGFGTNGQRCTAVKRLFVQEQVLDGFLDVLIGMTNQLQIGNPADPHTDIGPLIHCQAAEEIHRRIDDAVRAGAKIIHGGKREGSTITPTILLDVPAECELVAKETFGPVLPVFRFREIDEALKIINATPYGLQSGIYSNRLDVIQYFAEEAEVGAVAVNAGPGFRVELIPFGGVKESGLGREGIKYIVREMSELKTVVL